MTVSPEQFDWPDARQIAMVRRERRVRAQVSCEYATFVTSLGPDQADADRLLQLTRDHWSIENRLFHVRDVTFGEDACRVRSGHAPQNLAAARNVAITLIRAAGHTNQAAALRRYAAHPQEATALVRAP